MSVCTYLMLELPVLCVVLDWLFCKVRTSLDMHQQTIQFSPKLNGNCHARQTLHNRTHACGLQTLAEDESYVPLRDAIRALKHYTWNLASFHINPST